MVYVIRLGSRIRTGLIIIIIIIIIIIMFHPDPARKLYDIYHCCVYSEKLLMMDRGTV